MTFAFHAAIPLFFGIALMMMGNGLQGSLLALRADLEDFNEVTIGLIMAGYAVGFLLGSFLIPLLVRQVGHIRVFAVLASVFSGTILLHPVFIDPMLWFLLRVVSGCCISGLFIITESWLNALCNNSIRGKMLSIYMVISFSAMAAGQFLLIIGNPAGFGLFILVSILGSLSLLPIALARHREPSVNRLRTLPIAVLYRYSPLGFIACFFSGIAYSAIIGMGVVYAQGLGVSRLGISLFMASVYFGVIALSPPLGWLADRVDRRLIVLITTSLAALTALLTPSLFRVDLVSFYIGIGLYGGLCLSLYALSVAQINDYIDADEMLTASGTIILVSGVGAIIGPSIAGVAMHYYGGHALFWVLAIVHALLAVVCLYRMMQRTALPVAEQSAYALMTPRTGALAVATLMEETTLSGEEAVS